MLGKPFWYSLGLTEDRRNKLRAIHSTYIATAFATILPKVIKVIILYYEGEQL
jgi:hypothetical protein